MLQYGKPINNNIEIERFENRMCMLKSGNGGPF